ncbi:MAG: T9SS type A sorting domain-containing protein [Candidatus Cloacimonetes bacterium]|nr:T9SS type A sorting domain-containing protein [Candidatus Cloacimonadota bacterium]
MDNKGAVAYIGNATTTFLNVNWRVATGSNDPFAPLSPDEMGLFDALMHPEYDSIGKVINEMQKAVEGATGVNEDLKTRHIHALTLLGDPSLTICLGEPQEIAYSFEYYLNPGLLFIINSLPDVYFALSDENGSLIAADHTDSAGAGIIINDDFQGNYFKITVTAKNMIPGFAEIHITGNDDDDITPADWQCFNYPNPFRQSTTIRLLNNSRREMPGGDFAIYNLKGEKVKTLQLTPDEPELVWNGENEQGKKLPSGIYFLKSCTDNRSILSKLVLIK